MPGLLQYLLDKKEPTSVEEDPKPEDAKLWLQSEIEAKFCDLVCVEGLLRMEERLQESHCFNALGSIRHMLRVKTRLVLFKNSNIRGQRDSGCSRDLID
ncbi:hypothetical protein BT96DRAFT_809180 [Gymnopus androsaceus JB14]|uniref:Uncharacterized protein n=1 Tax=Gymnopus androsaceus JB14 TaxID=1447944 RepID=A0A6A4ICZ6_9AGAR|nr:hypothetical protein BT96DRAFT_809180 [Gymnopus androsaceus JB14]